MASVLQGFKPGQKVVILRLHAHGSNGEGVIIREGWDRAFPGTWLVLAENLRMHIEPERLVDYDAYWEEQRRVRLGV